MVVASVVLGVNSVLFFCVCTSCHCYTFLLLLLIISLYKMSKQKTLSSPLSFIALLVLSSITSKNRYKMYMCTSKKRLVSQFEPSKKP